MSEEVRLSKYAWLLGDGELPNFPSAEVDMEDVCGFALTNWQILPVVAPRLMAWFGNRLTENEPLISRITDTVAAVQTLAQIQLMLLNRFTKALDAEFIPYALLKGSATSLLAYHKPEHRCGLDVDVGVPKHYLRRAERILKQHGFLAASLDDSGRQFYRVDEYERAAVEEQHYELACLVRRQVIRGLDPTTDAAIRRSIPLLRPWHTERGGALGCYVTIDVHHGLCLDIEVDEMVSSAEYKRFGTYSVRIPRPAWLIFHLIFKIYWEGVHNYKKGVYQYSDLVRLVRMTTSRDSAELIRLLNEYSLEAAGFYVLRRLPTEFGITLDSDLQEFVSSAANAPTDEFPSDVNDAGDMWPKVWGYR